MASQPAASAQTEGETDAHGHTVSRSTYGHRRRLSLALAAALVAVVTVLPAAAFADDPTRPPADRGPVAKAPAADESTTNDPAADARIEAMITAARAYLGVAYRVGTEGPDTIDCSGLVFRAFSNAAELNQIGGSRLRAAGYLRWFAAHDLLTTDQEQAERGDLVIYGNGEHIGIYLGDGRVISALVTGVTVHSLAGITIPPTGFLAVDWTGKRGPFKPGHIVLPTILNDTPEAPAALVPSVAWAPEAPAEDVAQGPAVAGQERVDLRTANSRTYDDHGKLTTELFARPINYLPADSTEWQPIDLRFAVPEHSDSDAPGAVSDKSPVTVALADASTDAPLVALQAGDVSLAIDPHGAGGDAGAPQLGVNGEYADYRDLLGPGVGLRIFPRADGFKAFLILSREPDTRSVKFDVHAAGLTLTAEEDGSVTLRNADDAVVGRIPSPMLLDSSDIEGDGGAVRPGAVSLRVDSSDEAASSLTLVLNRAAMDEAVYPAFVDLGVLDFPNTASAALHTFASSAHPNSNFSTYQRPEAPGYAELWHGRRPDRRDDNEAYLRFPGLAGLLAGATIESASLDAFPYWQGNSEAPSTSTLARVTEDWDVRTLTWNMRPAAEPFATTVDTTQGQWSNIDVTSFVSEVVSGAVTNYGFVLHADDAGRGHWKRLVAESATGAGTLEPRLVVHWSGLKPAATPTTEVVASSAVLTWTNAGLAPAAARTQVQLSRDAFTTIESQVRLKTDAAAAGSLVVTTFDLAPGTWSWRVRTKYGDGSQWSDWSNTGTFLVADPHTNELTVL
jgi:cell wall-associated NlpC family hydrolase